MVDVIHDGGMLESVVVDVQVSVVVGSVALPVDIVAGAIVAVRDTFSLLMGEVAVNFVTFLPPSEVLVVDISSFDGSVGDVECPAEDFFEAETIGEAVVLAVIFAVPLASEEFSDDAGDRVELDAGEGESQFSVVADGVEWVAEDPFAGE